MKRAAEMSEFILQPSSFILFSIFLLKLGHDLC